MPLRCAMGLMDGAWKTRAPQRPPQCETCEIIGLEPCAKTTCEILAVQSGVCRCGGPCCNSFSAVFMSTP